MDAKRRTRLRAQISMATVGGLAGIVGAFLGAGVAWGSLHSRVAAIESEYMIQRPLLLSIDRSLSGIEQCIRDVLRRIDKLEEGK